MSTQLTLDGREVPHPLVAEPWLRDSQREMLRFIRGRETVRTYEIGILLHVARPNGCRGDGPGAACCEWAAPDGWRALDRLRRRGLVEQVSRGLWRAATPPDEAWHGVRRIDRAEVAEIVRLYVEERLTQTEVAARVYRAESTISYVLRREGVPARARTNRHRRLSEEQILETTELYGRGYSAQEVAALLGVSCGTVCYRIATYGRDGLRSGRQARAVPRERRRLTAAPA